MNENIETYTKTYGVEEGYEKGVKRYFTVIDGRQTNLHYARKPFAIEKARAYAISQCKEFVRFDGVRVRFALKQM